MPVSSASRRLLPVIALAAVSVAWAVFSAPAPPLGPASDGPELHDLMKGLKKNLKIVGESLNDPAADARTLAAVGEMQVLLLGAKRLEPSNLREMPRADRKAHTAAYRADIAKTLIETLNLEIALLEGRRSDAVNLVRGSLKDMRDEGHRNYEESDDH